MLSGISLIHFITQLTRVNSSNKPCQLRRRIVAEVFRCDLSCIICQRCLSAWGTHLAWSLTEVFCFAAGGGMKKTKESECWLHLWLWACSGWNDTVRWTALPLLRCFLPRLWIQKPDLQQEHGAAQPTVASKSFIFSVNILSAIDYWFYIKSLNLIGHVSYCICLLCNCIVFHCTCTGQRVIAVWWSSSNKDLHTQKHNDSRSSLFMWSLRQTCVWEMRFMQNSLTSNQYFLTT